VLSNDTLPISYLLEILYLSAFVVYLPLLAKEERCWIAMVHVTWGLIIACGKSEQFAGGADTAFLGIGGKPAISYSINAFEECADIDGIALVVAKDRMQETQSLVRLFGYTKVRRIAAGTARRETSIVNGLGAMDDDVSIVAVHDVSRPFVQPELISDTIKAAKRYGCGIAATKVEEAVKLAPSGLKVQSTVDVNSVWISQTPQTFKRDLLDKALKNAEKKGLKLQDEAEAVEKLKKPVHLVAASRSNMKMIGGQDLALAEAMLKM